MNIVLIGYRGTGKSTVGRLLAVRLGRELVSTDAEIVKRAQRTIPEIVAQEGWEYFRDLESDICRELASRDQLVIDTGDGIHFMNLAVSDLYVGQFQSNRLGAGGVETQVAKSLLRRIGLVQQGQVEPAIGEKHRALVLFDLFEIEDLFIEAGQTEGIFSGDYQLT